MKKMIMFSLKACWVILGFSFLAIYFFKWFPEPEQTTLLFTLTIAACFPFGLLVWLLLSFQSLYFPGLFGPKETDIIVRWLLIFLSGYFQWFVVVPVLINKFKQKSSSS